MSVPKQLAGVPKEQFTAEQIIEIAKQEGVEGLKKRNLENFLEVFDQNRKRPFWFAIETRDSDALNIFIQAFPYLMRAKTTNERACISYAAELGHVNIIRLLIQKGAYVDEPDYFGRTPLMISLAFGHEEAARTFIDAKANMDAIDTSSKTILHHAAAGGMTFIFRDFLQHISQKRATQKPLQYYLNVKDIMGTTPIMEAINGSQIKAVRVLLNLALELQTDIVNVAGGVKLETPLHFAAMKNLKAVIPDLLNHGAKVNKRNNRGDTPLSLAIEVGSEQAVEALVNAIPDALSADTVETFINMKMGFYNLSPLKLAENNNRILLIPFLMENGAVLDFTQTHFINTASILLDIYQFVKPCFNQEILRKLAQFIEILFLKDPKHDPVLTDREALKNCVRENFNKIKDVYFQNHKEAFRQVVAAFNTRGISNNIVQVEGFMTDILVNYIANFLLHAKNPDLFWEPFVDAATYEPVPNLGIEAVAAAPETKHDSLPALPRGILELILRLAIPEDEFTLDSKSKREEAKQENERVQSFILQLQQILLGGDSKPINAENVLFHLRLEYFGKNKLKEIARPDSNPFLPVFNHRRNPLSLLPSQTPDSPKKGEPRALTS